MKTNSPFTVDDTFVQHLFLGSSNKMILRFSLRRIETNTFVSFSLLIVRCFIDELNDEINNFYMFFFLLFLKKLQNFRLPKSSATKKYNKK